MNSYKLIFLLLAILTKSVNVVAQVSSTKGVAFEPSSLQEVQKRAITSNKSIFIELFSPSCHVCESFKPTFNQPIVGDYYNSKFISYKLDVDSKEAQEFLQKQHIYVPSLPLLFFYDKNMNLEHIQVVNNSANDLIAAANKAQHAGAKSVNFKHFFKQGERNSNFLIELAFFSRIVCDTTTNIEAVNAYVKDLPFSEYTSQTAFLVMQKVCMDAFNPLFDYFITNKAFFEKTYSPSLVKEVGENITMMTLYSGRANTFSIHQLDQLSNYLTKIGIAEKDVQSRTLIPELNFYIKQDNGIEASKRIDLFLSKVKTVPNDVNFLAQYISERSKNTTLLEKGISLCDQVLANENKHLFKVDAMYQKALIYKKLGNITLAHQNITQAIKLAKPLKVKIDKYQKLLNEIN